MSMLTREVLDNKNKYFSAGCPNKSDRDLIEITPEIFGLENQFSYFWKAETCSYLARLQFVKNELASQDGTQLKK